MVVLVLMMSCQVSEKPKNGPDAAQMRTTAQQAMNVAGCPAAFATLSAALPNIWTSFMVNDLCYGSMPMHQLRSLPA
ncbi:hypothetical protein GCM10007874_17840 [Labrys miyagiensis]|uniref:Lipoprotein n=1 Tax=Labrys miyagiensis TaxID=346912 RepID=A0ABQ6CEI9_9HYPH|nr:hypothetical protein GCM10007874_17840 [Labrys miyagiensis]